MVALYTCNTVTRAVGQRVRVPEDVGPERAAERADGRVPRTGRGRTRQNKTRAPERLDPAAARDRGNGREGRERPGRADNNADHAQGAGISLPDDVGGIPRRENGERVQRSVRRAGRGTRIARRVLPVTRDHPLRAPRIVNFFFFSS